ncbi:hypothetical protein KP509_37G004400 [Ceratopteris richardii]|uniref:HTH myb-type domain-containing protein n=1 Tax=Ceratopteris richardii TaxID=49495 RepID=A0A8T2Q617_CERRI|nr:hypothetical protein KP509_37G004400 [Ceratopteris richardii]
MELTLGTPAMASSENEARSKTKIHTYLRSLQDEHRKIKAFKRELPICMHLLSSEIEASWMQLYDHNDGVCHIGDLSCASHCTKSRSPMDKADYIISNILNGIHEDPKCDSFIRVGADIQASPPSVQKAVNNIAEIHEEVSAIANQLYNTRTMSSNEKPGPHKSTFGSVPGGAFVPFLRDKKQKLIHEDSEAAFPVQYDHQDVSYETARSRSHLMGNEVRDCYQQLSGLPFPSAPAGPVCTNPSDQTSSQRKPRRCWSAELHHKFVNALEHLGGSDVATPKQIREFMQVDGLTNDEVKSHLQKYRLHERRPNALSSLHISKEMPQVQSVNSPQLLLLGGIWVPQDLSLKESVYINSMDQMTDTSMRRHVDQGLTGRNLGAQAKQVNIASSY